MAAMVYPLDSRAEQEQAISDEQLQRAIAAKLTGQLKDKEVAASTAAFLMTHILTWQNRTLPLACADSILAFAFGNRIEPNGNQLPGPMNEDLADVAVELFQQTNKPVYAQWEVAQAVGDRIPSHHLFAIYPRLTAKGTIDYLCTKGVAERAIELAGGVSGMGKTLVVAFYEHSLRTIDTAKGVGIDAYAPEGVEMPNRFDAESGQQWTQDHLTYVMHEIRTRATNERERLIAKRNNLVD
ncbi:hypothetical protein C9I98_07875 [Photobacterium sanctipauli]|uniref:Uncharacterized protein n=1 Tax=Photobacterium sanctipauli TaxID=1342794 RepID=A0A2T3NWT1_9GAMM|nr:hypothetical protein [Photobacterium sanctipauli]PSW20750.1 hypothetical protein C9I98_07875 [Photobacterium sanctipauli]